MKIIFYIFFVPWNLIFMFEEKAYDFNEQIIMKVRKKKEKQYFETYSFFTVYFVYAGLRESFCCKLNKFIKGLRM